MSNSPLATKYGFQSFPHYTAGRSGATINKIVIHHAATTNFDSMPGVWQTRQASAHYGIGQKGEIRAYVDEANVAWHAGNWEANLTSIGIEHTNATGDPTWNVNQATIDASAKLCADIAKRHGLGQLVPYKNLFPHSQFTATACPGVLAGRLQEIANSANAMNRTPTAPTSGVTPYRVRLTWSNATSQKGAFNDLTNAKRCADANKGYSVFDGTGKLLYPSGSAITQPTAGYSVRVSITNLNIRTGPGTNYPLTGKTTGTGVFTIIEESAGQGATKWGKLKSGAGWGSLDYTQQV
jgi:hypothetical protein